MRTVPARLAVATAALAIAASFAPAQAANICRAATLTCASNMPEGGYCECTAQGRTESGTIQAEAAARPNSTAGGCGAQPNAAGCR